MYYTGKMLKIKGLIICINESHTKECGYDSIILNVDIFIKPMIDQEFTSLINEMGRPSMFQGFLFLFT